MVFSSVIKISQKNANAVKILVKVMENPEEILHSLEEFSKLKPKSIPHELEEYLCFVAKTGDPVYQWSTIKYLVREKLLNVIAEFYESCPTVDIPNCRNVEYFQYDTMKAFILEKLDTFVAAPFTVQRICELLTTPRKEYNRIDKYMRALEKNILVVSTMEPGNHRNAENGDGFVNGIESDHAQDSTNDINIEEMDDTPIWPTKTTPESDESVQSTSSSSSSKTEVLIDTFTEEAASGESEEVISTPTVLEVVPEITEEPPSSIIPNINENDSCPIEVQPEIEEENWPEKISEEKVASPVQSTSKEETPEVEEEEEQDVLADPLEEPVETEKISEEKVASPVQSTSKEETPDEEIPEEETPDEEIPEEKTPEKEEPDVPADPLEEPVETLPEEVTKETCIPESEPLSLESVATTSPIETQEPLVPLESIIEPIEPVISIEQPAEIITSDPIPIEIVNPTEEEFAGHWYYKSTD